MFRKLLATIGIGAALAATPAMAQPYQPYPFGSAANDIYPLLFCDDAAGFQPRAGTTPADWQLILFGADPDPAKVRALANDESAESRVRALAFNWLRAHGEAVPKGVLLGSIIEVPLDGGLDVLAVYADGRIRYLNQTGKIAIVEPGGMPDVQSAATRVVELSRTVVSHIGPWDKARLPPPQKPDVRLTFVVSDGLYFGQGQFEVMEQDPLAGPLLQEATKVLTIVTQLAIKDPQPSQTH